jgi:hypothetical protein
MREKPSKIENDTIAVEAVYQGDIEVTTPLCIYSFLLPIFSK